MPLSISAAANPTVEDSLVSAKVLLQSLDHTFVGVPVERLIEVYERVDHAYDEFPELELEYPREGLAEKLRSATDALPDDTAVPLLMFCVAIAPTSASSASALLDRMARSPHGQALAGVVRVLARKRHFAWSEIAPAIAQLRRQGRMDAALAMISAVLGRLHLAPDGGYFELGNILRDLLIDGGDRANIDPSLLAGVAWSARNRLRETTPRRAQSAGANPWLSLAERVSAKLSSSRLPPASPVLPPRLAWPSRRLAFADFAAQWSGISGIEVDWLPMMRVGDAGERVDGLFRSKTGQRGYVAYGPYFRVPPGEYHVRARVVSRRSRRWLHQRQPVAMFEAVANGGNSYLAQKDIRWQDLFRPKHEFTFIVTEAAARADGNIVELRVWTDGTIPLSLLSITVERQPH